MTHRFRVQPLARTELAEQATYLEIEGGDGLADRFLDAAESTFRLLASHGKIGWQARVPHLRAKGIRVFRIRGFERLLVVYRPTEEGVDILRVLHSSRDLDALLSDELID